MDSDRPLLESVEDPHLDPWADYLGDAVWTRTPPMRPGIYAIATREGHHVGYREFRMREGELVDTLTAHGEPGWQAWFWSHPLPSPPREIPN